jgi:hypothetical protein
VVIYLAAGHSVHFISASYWADIDQIGKLWPTRAFPEAPSTFQQLPFPIFGTLNLLEVPGCEPNVVKLTNALPVITRQSVPAVYDDQITGDGQGCNRCKRARFDSMQSRERLGASCPFYTTRAKVLPARKIYFSHIRLTAVKPALADAQQPIHQRI